MLFQDEHLLPDCKLPLLKYLRLARFPTPNGEIGDVIYTFLISL